MPFGNASLCEGTQPDTCAFEVSRYLYETFLDTEVVESAVLDADGNLIEVETEPDCAQTQYGRRQVKLLSSTEIQRSLELLLGIDFSIVDDLPTDFELSGFTNQIDGIPTQAHAQAYFSVAGRVATWARARNFSGVEDLDASCASGAATDLAACQGQLLDGLGRRLFRRPLTTAERSDFARLIELSGDNVQIALELTLTTLLNSPGFLYRSEIGLSVDAAISRLSVGQSRRTTVNARDFSVSTAEFVFDDERNGTIGKGIASTGHIEHMFAFGASNTITIVGRGQPYLDEWPRLSVAIGGEVVGEVTLGTDGYEPYTLSVTGTPVGDAPLRLAFINDGSAPDYRDGDRNAIVADVTVESTSSVDADALAELDRLASDAFVLDSYESAALLSYTLTGGPPDAELLERASAVAVFSKEEILAQAARLLASPSARRQMGEFVTDWLGTDYVLDIGKSSERFPGFNEDIRADMVSEA
ncbi:MAG: DUF1592 domain-containing protein, partial [Myxococcota bacterium]